MKTMYPINLQIPASFSTNEYRRFIRELFQMDLTSVEEENQGIQKHNNEPWDEETKDEMLYDGDGATNFMDFVEKETKTNSVFVGLYEKAAAKMFSTDLGIGLAVLFSYDYIHYFHKCLVDYFTNARTLEITNPNFQALNELLS